MPIPAAARCRPALDWRYRLEVMDDAPALYWPFDETTGSTATGRGGVNSPGTHRGTYVLFNRDSVQRSPVIYYNVGSTQITSSFISAPTALSVELWARKAVDTSLNHGFYIEGQGSGQRLAQAHISWVDGTIYWDCGTGAVSGDYDRINKVRDFTVTDWHHYVFTKNVTTGVMNTYVDGVLWNTGSGFTKPIGTSTVCTVGAFTDGTTNPFNGYMCHFAVYNKELSATRVAAHYAAATRVAATGTLTLVWDMRPDITSGNAGDITTQTLTVNGTSIGQFSSNGANAAGPAVWVTRSADVTSLVSAGQMVSITTAYTSGADTGYFRNMYIRDGSGRAFYGGYPSGALYPEPFTLTGGASEYLWMQGGGAPNQFSVLTNSYVSNPSGDSLGHYYIPVNPFVRAS